jgi:hypothetical protein
VPYAARLAGIFFYSLRQTAMALAISTNEAAAVRMNTVDPRPDREIPGAPVWV